MKRMIHYLVARRCKLNSNDQLRIKRFTCYGDFHRSISEHRLPQYKASKYLFALAGVAKLNFHGASTFAEAT